jgi:hypothetical protein
LDHRARVEFRPAAAPAQALERSPTSERSGARSGQLAETGVKKDLEIGRQGCPTR